MEDQKPYDEIKIKSYNLKTLSVAVLRIIFTLSLIIFLTI